MQIVIKMVSLWSKANNMKNLLLGLALILFVLSCETKPDTSSTETKIVAPKEKVGYALAIHGGAGFQTRESIDKETDKAVRVALNEALDAAEAILKNGGAAGDAVVAAIEILENNPEFNAGKGAVFTHDETNELDASFMDGSTMDAGAVGGVSVIKNPIKAARAVMENSPHVMLVGRGAEAFAKEQNIELVDASYFRVEDRLKSLKRAKENENEKMSKHGTVGCVAMDKSGNLAAGTSTGGMTNKRWNRIGDSPIIGAGTYANNNTCAVSSTGHGEFFIRYTVAHDISALMEYKELSLEEAANHVIQDKLKKVGGNGGVICVDKDGNISTPYNTPGMYRGYVTDKSRGVAIYKDEKW